MAIIRKSVVGAGIVDGSIGTADIADEAITAAKIAPGAVPFPPTVNTITPTSYNGESGTNFTITGNNFSDCTVTFITASGSLVNAGSVTITSSSSLTVTSPQDFTVADGPLDIKIENGSGLSVVVSDAISTGSGPTWTTAAGTIQNINFGDAVSTSVAATDSDGTLETYTLISGSLPENCTLNTSTGAITGTPTTEISTTTYTFTIRATDSASNTIDREFNIIVTNRAPIWVTSQGSLGSIVENNSVNIQLSATDPDGGNITYTLASGTLPAGTSLSSSGLISGTASEVANDTTYNFTIAAVDSFGSTTTQDFSYEVTNDPTAVLVQYANTTASNYSSSFTVPTGINKLHIYGTAGGGGGGHQINQDNGHGAGGGGAANISNLQVNVTPGQTITYQVGGGGNGGSSSNGSVGGETNVYVAGSAILRLGGGGGGGTNGGGASSGGSVITGTGGVAGGGGGAGGYRNGNAATNGGSTTNGTGGGGGGGGHLGNRTGGTGGSSTINVGTYTIGPVSISFAGGAGGGPGQNYNGNAAPAIPLALGGHGQFQDGNTGAGGGAGRGIKPSINGTPFTYFHGAGGGGNRSYIMGTTSETVAGISRRHGSGGGGFLIIVGTN